MRPSRKWSEVLGNRLVVSSLALGLVLGLVLGRACGADEVETILIAGLEGNLTIQVVDRGGFNPRLRMWYAKKSGAESKTAYVGIRRVFWPDYMSVADSRYSDVAPQTMCNYVPRQSLQELTGSTSGSPTECRDVLTWSKYWEPGYRWYSGDWYWAWLFDLPVDVEVCLGHVWDRGLQSETRCVMVRL